MRLLLISNRRKSLEASDVGINWSTVRRSTSGGIKFKLVSGPEIEHSDEGTSARETYLIQASQVAAFIAESLPPPYVLGFYVILPPRRRLPGTLFLVTKKVSVKPQTDQLPGDPFSVDAAAEDGTYDHDYLVNIEYEVTKEADTNREQSKPETFLEHSMQAGGEFYTIDKARLRYTEDGNEPVATRKDDYLIGSGRGLTEKNLPGCHLSVATLEHTLRWPMVLSPDWNTFFGCLGRINDSQTVLFNNAAKGTVLFSSIGGTQKYVWNGAAASVQPWTLDFKFSQRVLLDGETNITWNHVFHPNAEDGAKWVEPFWLTNQKDINSKKYLYEYDDLYAMFKTSV